MESTQETTVPSARKKATPHHEDEKTGEAIAKRDKPTRDTTEDMPPVMEDLSHLRSGGTDLSQAKIPAPTEAGAVATHTDVHAADAAAAQTAPATVKDTSASSAPVVPTSLSPAGSAPIASNVAYSPSPHDSGIAYPQLSRTQSFYPGGENPAATLAVKLLPASSGIAARRARIVPEYEHLSRLVNRQVALGRGTPVDSAETLGSSSHGYNEQWHLFYVDHDGDVLDICDQDSLSEAIYNIDARHPCFIKDSTGKSSESGYVKPLVLYVYLPGQHVRKDCNQAVAAEIRERFHGVSGASFPSNNLSDRDDAKHQVRGEMGSGAYGVYPIKHQAGDGDVSIREHMEKAAEFSDTGTGARTREWRSEAHPQAPHPPSTQQATATPAPPQPGQQRQGPWQGEDYRGIWPSHDEVSDFMWE